MSNYQVPVAPLEQPHTAEEVIKGSRFIARLIYSPSVAEAKAYIKSLNLSEPEATHHCWAYIVGNPKSTTLLACSDDGEPNGTAGMPMLNVLKHADIGDITAVVTRHYGGTKLGTGGLARAYGGSVKLAMDSLIRAERIFTSKFQLDCSYELQQQIEYLLKAAEGKVIQTEFDAQVKLVIEVPDQYIDSFKQSLGAYRQQIDLSTADS